MDARGEGWDAFISHSSHDLPLAGQIGQSLGDAGLSVWLDDDNLRAGALLANRLMEAISSAENLVVIWSETAAASEWVNTEWTTVVNLNHQPGAEPKGIIPCVTDETALAPFLLNYIYCDFRGSYDTGIGALQEALGGRAAPTPKPESPAPPEFVIAIYAAQQGVLASLQARDLAEAKRLQTEVDSYVVAALTAKPDDPYVLALAGYHEKNAYMITHWDEIQAGLSPPDPSLDKATQLFFQALAHKPEDPSALNGLGSVLILRRDLDAAEFYVLRALQRSQEEGLPYAAAEHDLQVIRRLKAAPGSDDA